MQNVKDKLMDFFENGKLVPITTIRELKHLPPATVCRWGLTGKIPVLRIGRRLLTHPEIVREALSKFIVASEVPPGGRSPRGAKAR